MEASDELFDNTISYAFFYLCERGCTATPEAVTATVSFAIFAGLPDDQVAARDMEILTRAKVLLGASAVQVNR
jgi:hypothetical protein